MLDLFLFTYVMIKLNNKHELDLELIKESGELLWQRHSSNPEDRWIKKEWVTETHVALEWHITWIYVDPNTWKTMLLWQWDGVKTSSKLFGQREDGSIVVEYDSDEHWKLCDVSMFFRWVSETPPRYYDPTHTNYARSEKTRNDISHHVAQIMNSFDPDFMKQFQKK